MAKIVLVSEHINATAWQLAKSLRNQQHEVIFLTSHQEEPLGDLQNIQLMTFFKKWNFTEGFKFLLALISMQPQIIHLLLEEDRMNKAQVVLSTFAKSFPNCILTTSILNIRFGLHRRNPVRYLIEESDVITCPSIENLGQLRGLNIRATTQGRGILAPALDFGLDRSQQHEQNEAEEHLISNLEKNNYFVVPFSEQNFNPKSHNLLRIRTLAQKKKLALWGSYSHWTLRDRKKFASWMKDARCEKNWIVTGIISEKSSQQLLENSQAFVLAGQILNPIEATEYYLRAIHAKSVTILDSRQASVHSDLWKNSINCWIVNHDNIKEDLAKLIERSDLDVPQTISEEVAQNKHLIDSSMNELNRLYNKALQNKTLYNRT